MHRGISASAAIDFAENFPPANTGCKKRGEAGGHREARHGVEVHFHIFVLPAKNRQ